MKISLRALIVGMLFVALLLTGLIAHPALAQAAGVDFWELPDLRFGQDQMQAERVVLERQGETTYRRTRLRYETIVDVAGGRLSFDEGVARFVQLNRASPVAASRVPELFPGDTEEDRAAWQLIGQLRANPHLKADAVADEAACRMVERS